MMLAEIDFTSLQECSKPGRWGEGDPASDRLVYRNERCFYKLWSAEYTRTMVRGDGGEFVELGHTNNAMHGFEIGFLDGTTAGVFREFIYDEAGMLRGYVTAVGEPPALIPEAFIDRIIERSMETGWVHSDFCINNVVMCEGNASLVDFDSHFSRLENLDVAFERALGCLREHNVPRYSGFIEGYVRGRGAPR